MFTPNGEIMNAKGQNGLIANAEHLMPISVYITLFSLKYYLELLHTNLVELMIKNQSCSEL